MKEILEKIAPVALVLAFFAGFGYVLDGWIFWAVILGVPALILGGLLLAYEVDICLISLMGRAAREDEKGMIWNIAHFIHGRKMKRTALSRNEFSNRSPTSSQFDCIADMSSIQARTSLLWRRSNLL